MLLAAALGCCVLLSSAIAADHARPQPKRQRDGAPAAPKISFINSLTPQCYSSLVDPNVCYVNWYRLQVTASPGQYMERMTITLNGRVSAVYSGFFQTSMVVQGGLNAEGFKVVCGVAGVSGDPDFGYEYSYVIRARETGGLSATNSGTVKCPADYRQIFRNGFE
jgi:opacity protein-like surface antigen